MMTFLLLLSPFPPFFFFEKLIVWSLLFFSPLHFLTDSTLYVVFFFAHIFTYITHIMICFFFVVGKTSSISFRLPHSPSYIWLILTVFFLFPFLFFISFSFFFFSFWSWEKSSDKYLTKIYSCACKILPCVLLCSYIFMNIACLSLDRRLPHFLRLHGPPFFGFISMLLLVCLSVTKLPFSLSPFFLLSLWLFHEMKNFFLYTLLIDCFCCCDFNRECLWERERVVLSEKGIEIM